MSAMSGAEQPSAQELALSALASNLTALSARIDGLSARTEQSSGELQAQMNTALEALELLHDDDPSARRRLTELRASADYDAAFTVADPLVSVVIPTWNRVDTLIERAVASALAQTHTNIEVIVVGDASPPAVEQAIANLDDPRVRFHNLTIRGPYDEDGFRAWLASGTPGFNAGVEMARGLWIAPLGDDDAFEPHHVERLLTEARERRLEFVYSRSRMLLPDGSETSLGEFPPRLHQVGLQFAIYHSGLGFMELELGHALFGKPNDWGLVHRMMRVGVRMGMVDEATVVYRPSLRGQRAPGESPALSSPADVDGSMPETGPYVSDPAARVADLERQLDDERALVKDLDRRLEEVRRSKSWRLTAPLRRLRERGRRY